MLGCWDLICCESYFIVVEWPWWGQGVFQVVFFPPCGGQPMGRCGTGHPHVSCSRAPMLLRAGRLL